MSKIVSQELKGLWFDPLEKIWWTYRPEDPKEYSHICPHCQKRYGDKSIYITVRRCDTCPVFVSGLETPWDFTKATYKELQKQGYFPVKEHLKKPRRKKHEVDTTTLAAQGGKGNEETGNRS